MRNIKNYNSIKFLVISFTFKYEVESNVPHASLNLPTVDSFSHREEDQQSEEQSLRKTCPYSELFWSVFSHIRTEYGEMRSISPYSVRMGEHAGQNNYEYGQFLRSQSVREYPYQELSFEKNGQ